MPAQYAPETSSCQADIYAVHNQTAQQVQWEAERHGIELKAAHWCEAQVQSAHREAAEAMIAAEVKSDSWYVSAADAGARSLAVCICVTYIAVEVLITVVPCAWAHVEAHSAKVSSL